MTQTAETTTQPTTSHDEYPAIMDAIQEAQNAEQAQAWRAEQINRVMATSPAGDARAAAVKAIAEISDDAVLEIIAD